MRRNGWNIWHSNITYIINDFDKYRLERLTELLLKNDFCILACQSDGKNWLKHNGKIVDTDLISDLTRKFDKNCITQSRIMRLCELRLFSKRIRYFKSFADIFR